ncbi:uncharacterized protein LOC111136932 [Crassostrea virginica]
MPNSFGVEYAKMAFFTHGNKNPTIRPIICLVSQLCVLLVLPHQSQGTIPPAALFVGMGYNLLKGNPDGDSHINAGKDPGLLMTCQILKLDPPDSPRELSYHEYPLCFQAQYKEIFYGTKSYQDRLLHDLIDTGNTTKEISVHAFTLSEGYQRVSHETIRNEFVYIDEITLCNKGRSRYMSGLAHSHKFNIGDEFAATVCSLPTTYDQSTYMKFLQDWGTHVVMETEIGWETKTRKRIAVEDIIQVLIKTNPELLVPTGANGNQSSSISLSRAVIDDPTYISGLDLRSKITTISTTSKGSDHISEPIKYKIEGIDMMLDVNYWQAPADIEDENLCARGFVSLLPVWRSNIQQALKSYAAYLQAPTPTDSIPKYSVEWPSPPFALPEPLSGCPTDNGPWVVGRVTHTINASSAAFQNNTFHYQGLNLKGLQTFKTLEISYCGREQSTIFPSDLPWPAGSYCIAAQTTNSCPSGFNLGYIVLSLYPVHYREPPGQNVTKTGSFQGININPRQNYLMYYCCRNDGSESVPIILPHQEPFYLYPEHRTMKCQKVFGMRSSDQWIKYPHTQSGDRCHYYYPYDEDCNRDHKVHYCYYTRDTILSSTNVVG